MKKVQAWVIHNKAWIISGILAIIIGFFGINFQAVKSIFFKLWVRPATKAWTLTDENAVINQGGEIHAATGDNFVDKGCKPGFISKGKKDAIIFQMPDNLTHLNAGSIELCVTLEQDLEPSSDYFLFAADQGPNNSIFLKLDWSEDPPQHNLRLRLRREPSASRDKRARLLHKVNWKADEHHHIAGTWGSKGMYLYIDGQLAAAAATKDHRDGGPKVLRGDFAINNDSADEDLRNTPGRCIVSNLLVSNYQKSTAEVKESYEKLHSSESF